MRQNSNTAVRLHDILVENNIADKVVFISEPTGVPSKPSKEKDLDNIHNMMKSKSL